MRRSPIMPTVLFTPARGQVRCRYVAPPVLKKRSVVPPDESQPGLVADSLNPAKARILLMTALTQTKDPLLIQQYFHTY